MLMLTDWQKGLNRGDVVGLWSCNTYYWPQILYACARLGLIQCSINPAYQADELNYVLRNAQVKALFMPGVGSKQYELNKFGDVLNNVFQLDDKFMKI
ncbi:unnamed protein product [Oppiella nova]|uniref:Medium-chain acyl-CoA ligase ACSF2, mitochondrial n=1 Tax=Oppiella nova TaxID=334625 RepID=A0A7R9LPJ1_9ACAR|nr:unnamed protein product [Oppiella nova]CAG2165695.1 unnamed protein product [Oppiella nova]